MGLIQPYSGKYVTAKSASSEIDADAIIAGCDSVDSAISKMTSVLSNIYSEGSKITSDALSFDGVNISGVLDECYSNMSNGYNNVIQTTNQIREQAISIYNQLQEQYNQEAKTKDMQMASLENKKNN